MKGFDRDALALRSVKIMIGITFGGLIVHYTGPHHGGCFIATYSSISPHILGTSNDAMILANYPPAFEPWEWGLGDGESSMPLSLVVHATCRRCI